MSGNNNQPKTFLGSLGGNKQFDEERPELRHVKISSARPGPTLLQPKLPGLKLPGPPPKSLRPVSKALKQQKSLTVKKEWSAKFAWIVQPDEIDPVPLGFPLERTHREIHDSDAGLVAERISTALQKLSIQAEYEKDEAKCETSDFVAFRVRLFSGGEGCNPVIVEVQRRKGPVMSFMQTCKAILCAAEGVEAKKAAPPPFKGKSLGQMKCLQGLSMPVVDPNTSAETSVKKVVELLQSEKADVNVLGSEQLATVTDPLKSPRPAARIIAKKFFGNAEFDARNEMFSCLRKLDENYAGDEDGALANQFRLHTLRTIDNCLSLVSLHGLLRQSAWVRESLIEFLVETVKASVVFPHHGHLAAASLDKLLVGDEDAKEAVLECEGSLEALEEANKHGEEYHELLATETKNCLKRLQA